MNDILTAAELDALPVASCVIDRYGDILQKHHDGLWYSYETRPLWSAKVAKFAPRLYESGPQ